MSAALVPRRAKSQGLSVFAGQELPALVAQAGPKAGKRFLEFFTAQIRNENTREAYARAVVRFMGWCKRRGIRELDQVEPVVVAAYVEGLGRELAAPSETMDTVQRLTVPTMPAKTRLGEPTPSSSVAEKCRKRNRISRRVHAWFGWGIVLLQLFACATAPSTDRQPAGFLGPADFVGDPCPSIVERDEAFEPLLDFEGAVDLGAQTEPRTSYSGQSSVRIESEPENRFLRIAYETIQTKPATDDRGSPHSKYNVTLPYRRVGAGSVLVFRYRSRGITTAVVILDLLDQRLSWRIGPQDTDTWKKACLLLDPRFEKDPTRSRTARLSIISYSKLPLQGNPSSIEFDDIRIVQPPDPLGTRSAALARRIKQRSENEARIAAALELGAVRTSRAHYLPEDRVFVTFEIRNRSDTALVIPRDRSGANRYPLVTTQMWLVPLDASARQTDLGRAARKGGRFPAGGRVRFLQETALAGGRILTFSRPLRPLESGRYRVYVQLLDIRDNELLMEASAEFEIVPQ